MLRDWTAQEPQIPPTQAIPQPRERPARRSRPARRTLPDCARRTHRLRSPEEAGQATCIPGLVARHLLQMPGVDQHPGGGRPPARRTPGASTRRWTPSRHRSRPTRPGQSRPKPARKSRAASRLTSRPCPGSGRSAHLLGRRNGKSAPDCQSAWKMSRFGGPVAGAAHTLRSDRWPTLTSRKQHDEESPVSSYHLGLGFGVRPSPSCTPP